MGMDITVFANHTIDFSNHDFEIIANNIKKLLDNSIIKNNIEIKEQIRSYYDWQGYDDKMRIEWHNKIDNWISNNWKYYINNDWDNYILINYYGPFRLQINITNNRIEFKDPGCRYDSFFGMDKKYRTEWRKYYYQIITLLGGSFAIYLPDQGDVASEFTEKIWDHNISLDVIKKGLIEKYGHNIIKIDDFPIDENDFIDFPYYFIDTFEDIKNVH